MKVRAFITHKLSEHYADCQDRFCINVDNRTIAVSDGMSQSIFPEYWAELLSEHYALHGHCTEEDRKELCAKWLCKVNGYLEEQVNIGKNPWRLKNNIASRIGAGATICGVRFENATNWKGDVLGDSCIIEVNVKDWTARILSSEDKAFDSHPDYYDSFPEKQGVGEIKEFNGTIGPNDILLLVSDPFSEYFAKYKDNCRELIEQILAIEKHDEFCSLVDKWRDNGMHNDDSTLCIVEFDNDINLHTVYKDEIQDLIDTDQELKVLEEGENAANIVEEPTNENASNLTLSQEQPKADEDLRDSIDCIDKLEVFYEKVMNVFSRLINSATSQAMPEGKKSGKSVSKWVISKLQVEDALEEIKTEYINTNREA